ncbi:D-alanine--D-alanyl carrier protein ligase [Seminavis robusta]|uniref:D-alanine--D-alanyl carrier protein ligase n=1 Tax=Seminavis robusta TaxID=568900 RepID=A0A9N8DJT2_9STRA|nr:D-alanine--D-alanyl carrier protein ligase [Seminavis robusta]|eukprot:Sro192_g082470.1 D-alanine--D-alanyl carrier protein ligase (1939) ;mRNA; f:32761-38766
MRFFSTILEALNHHAIQTPDKVVFTWVNNKCEEQNKMTFKQLENESNAVAARLLKLGCKKGDRVMVAYPFGLEFLAGMFGAMKIGVIPCSIYPPNPNQLKIDMPKFRGFAEDAGAKFALSTNKFVAGMTAASVLYKTGVTWIGTDKLSIKKSSPQRPKNYEKFVGEPEDICFIQYTSGSTGRPKGVMISHNNLAENCRAVGTSLQLTSTSLTASWVPQYHDMGLVGGFMSTLYSGAILVMASPLDFLSKPILWADLIEKYRASHTCAPNFAYALLVKKLKKANRTADWSCLQFAGFGAEPTQKSVVEDVAKTLSVRPGNVCNLYGLAESVVWLTGGPAIPDSEGLVCCGEVDSPTLKLRIVQDGKEVDDGQVGSIWAQSPRVAAGYYGQSELTTATFANVLPGYDGTWLDTGDLGKIMDGQLYVTGRVKDVIIINGKNYYPTDVELSIDEAFGHIIRPGRTTAFQHGEDSIGITVEARKGFDKSANADLAIQVSNHVSQIHGLFATEVLVLKVGVTPKTTSGKLKRCEIRQTTMAGGWNESSMFVQFQRNDQTVPMVDDNRNRRPTHLTTALQGGSDETMHCFSTILEALNHHAIETPDKVVLTWVDKECEEQNKLTFKQLEDQSNAVAARLLKLGCKKGDRVMVAYPFGLEFLAGMFGAMKIGVIPCSIYPPNPNQLKTEMPKFRRFAEDAGAKFALSTNNFATGMTAASVLYKTGVTWIGTDKLAIKKHNPNTTTAYERFLGEPNDICFIQYTSGSTGHPKGVMVTHNNLVETCTAGISLTDLNIASVAALWVPQYHDMGLTGFMSCLYTASQLVVASPLDFIAKPLLWTDMVEKYKATHTSAPNFAYALLLKRLEQANRKSHWSCMKAAMFGGEPAQSHVVEAVAKTLSIKPEHVYNIYGMAEMVVFVTGGPAKIHCEEGLVSCGKVDSPSLKIRIVQDGQEVVEDGEVGSIWTQSPRVAAGYYGQSKLTSSTFANALASYDGTWLDTGDLGKIVDGQLYVTGRVKDVIIVNGKNYYPTDVELSIDEAFGDIIRPGRTTAFQHGEDSVGITVEARKGFEKAVNQDLAVQIANHVSRFHGLYATEVLVLKLGVTPKTTSGKLKRSEIKHTTIAGDWKEPSILVQFQRNEVAAREFDISERTKSEIMQQSVRSPHGMAWGTSIDDSIAEPGSSLQEKDESVDTFPSRFSILLSSVLGGGVDTCRTWAENGLTSLKSAELRNSVEEEFHVSLPTDFEQQYPTPTALADFLVSSEGQSFPEDAIGNHEFEWHTSRSKCSKLQLGIAQALGSFVILSLFLLSFIPSYYLGSWVLDQCDSDGVQECNFPFIGIILPLLFPLFILSFSVIVVLCKHAVVGCYEPRQLDLLSWKYIRWWFVDRLLEIWESLLGHFVVDSRYIWIFYWLLGADLAWSAKINSYIREFDLVKVGENATIGHPLKCRKFSQHSDGSTKLTFRPIVVGKNCQISGMVSPGVKIGEGSKVDKLTAVKEGAVIPNGVLARGVPAYNAGLHIQRDPKSQEDSLLGSFKIAWRLLEVYYFFALYYLVHTLLLLVLPAWRYATILHWFLLIPASSSLALLTSIPLKWLLIGKRDPADAYEATLWRRATNWACDFHFRVAALPITPFIGQSRLWSVILFLHGLDVDMASVLNINPYTKLSPSRVDFVKIRKSFVATITFEFDCKADSKIEIVNSSVGYHVNVHSGVKIVRSMIPPRTDLLDSIYDVNEASQNLNLSILMNIILPELSQQVLNAVLFASLIPSYEIVYYATQTTSSTWIAMPCFVAALFTLLLVWILSARTVEWLMLKLPRNLQQCLFGVYINHVWFFRIWNLLEVLLSGTPMFAYYAQFMGAKVDGDLWYFGIALYEYGKMHFQGRTVVVDSSSLNGHYIDGNGLTIDDVCVSGVLHPGCFVVAGSVLSGKENGPGKVFLSNVGDGTGVMEQL